MKTAKKVKAEIRPYEISFTPEAGGGQKIVFTSDNVCELAKPGHDSALVLKCHDMEVFKCRQTAILSVVDLKNHQMENIEFAKWLKTATKDVDLQYPGKN